MVGTAGLKCARGAAIPRNSHAEKRTGVLKSSVMPACYVVTFVYSMSNVAQSVPNRHWWTGSSWES